jgi:hypothetical protein
MRSSIVFHRGDVGRIRAGIAHWTRLRDGEHRPFERPGNSDCSLCQEYCRNCRDSHLRDGKMCPLAQYVGVCGRGASNPWRAAFERWNWGAECPGPGFKRAAQRMIDTLRDLLSLRPRRPSRKKK